MKLTISMATYDDYDGVFFTIQSLRIHQNLPVETEFLVLDNNPDSAHGQQTKRFVESQVKGRYVPVTDRRSSFVKYDAFKHATGDVVLGLDCHVLLKPGFIDALMGWWRDNPESPNNLTGPLIYDCLSAVSTHMEPTWRGSDYGTWGTNNAAMATGLPFEVPMQGMGCFSFWRDKFKLLTVPFQHFGAEEWYIAERTRRNGGKTLCHPAMGWNHRFDWPPRTFPMAMKDKVANYYRGWLDLYGDMEHPMMVEMSSHWDKEIQEQEHIWAVQQALHPR